MKEFLKNVPPLTALIGLGIIVGPTAIGLFRAPAYTITNPLEMFSLGTELVALIFPLFAALLATARINAEVGDGFIRSIRTRAIFPKYLKERLLGAALAAFAAFFVGIFIWFVVCFYLTPASGVADESERAYATPESALQAASTAETLSQLIAVHPIAYGIGYSSWVGLWAALWAMCTGLLLLILPNRIAAYAIPTVFYWLENTILSNIGLPSFRSTYSAFPSGMTQQAPYVVVVPYIFLLAASAILWIRLRIKKFDTAPLT